MASTVITQNKKAKSTLPSLGVRLQSVLARDRITDRGTPVASERLQPRSIRVIPPKHRDTIDEMASALLNSPGDETQLSTPESRPKTLRSPMTASPVDADAMGHSNLPSGLRHRPSRCRIEKCSPSLARRSTRRSAGGGGRTSQRAGATRLTRPLPRSQTFANPLSQNPPRLPHSASVNIGAPALLDSRPPNLLTHEDITRKMEMMLAATSALKPGPAEKKSLVAAAAAAATAAEPPSSSIMSRLKTSKVFSKMSSAFQSKPSAKDKESKVRGKITHLTLADQALVAPLTLAPSALLPTQLPRERSPIKSLELRVNEGYNLNRKKVQQLIGGSIPRKPLPDDGKSLRSNKSVEDPFSEPPRITRTPTSFERRLRNSYKDESYVPPLPTSNPYEAERILERSLDAPLLSSPLATSTPPPSVRHIRALSDTPIKRLANAVSGRLLGQSSSSSSLADLHRDGSFATTGDSESTDWALSFANRERLEDSENNITAFGDMFHPGQDEVMGFTMKKHPSPTKDQLQFLSRRITSCINLTEPERLGYIAQNAGPQFRAESPVIQISNSTGHSVKPPTLTVPAFVRAVKSAGSSASGESCHSPAAFNLSSRKHLSPVDANCGTPKQRKKHPSPSMQDLEALDRQFQRCQKVATSADDDVDELAYSFNGLLTGSKTMGALKMRDANQRLGTSASGANPISREAMVTCLGSVKGTNRARIPKTSTESRLPRPVETLSRSRNDIRMPIRFHPTPADSLSIDELQWDASQYMIGRTAAAAAAAAQVH